MKKLYTLFNYCILMMFTIIIFSLNSCSKEEEEAKTETETVVLNADKNQYAPYEMVTISSSQNLFSTPSFAAKINNIDINVVTDQNIASFVLPNLANGNYDLSFTLNDKNYIIPITATSLSTVLSSDQYFTEIKTSISKNITDLNLQISHLEQNSTNPSEYETLKNDIVKYTDLLNSYTASYNNLSTEEKQEFAKYMAANKTFIDEHNRLTKDLNSSTANLKNANTVVNYEANVEISMRAFVAQIIFTTAHIPAMITTIKLIASPIPWVSAGAIAAAGMISISYCVNVDETIVASEKLTIKSLKPFEFITQTSETVYDSGIETVSNIQSKYRSLMNSDSNDSSNGSTVNIIVEKYDYFKNKYNSFVSEIPSVFKPSHIITSLKSTYNSATRSVYNKYISITNVSNSNVILEQINQSDGSIKIKATTNSDSDQTFTYDVNYTNENFTNGLRKTINAKVLAPSDSIKYYTKLMIGECTLNFGSSLEKQFYVLNDDGSFLQTGGIDGNGNSYTTHECVSKYNTWYVYKDVKGYSIGLKKPYESRNYTALIINKGNIEFTNAFNTCSGGCTPPQPCW